VRNQTKLEESMMKLAEVNKRTGFKARQIEVDADGAMILDASNPTDWKWWYEKDEDYDVV
jgi:hypothetical protein